MQTAPDQSHIQQPSGTSVALGRHLSAEFYNCSAQILADAARMETIFLEAARISGATIVESHFHLFSPQGVSGVVIISESHFAVHAWPEHDYAAVDLFTCGDSVNFSVALEYLSKALQGNCSVSNFMYRGVLSENGMPCVCGSTGNAVLPARTWHERFVSSQASAVSALVDVYDCRTTGSQAEILRELADKLSLIPAGEPVPIGKRRWAIPLENGTLSFRMAQGKIAYFDSFLEDFFDPRSFADAALEILQGSRYRLQVQLRQ